MRTALSIGCEPVRHLRLQRASDLEIFTAARSARVVVMTEDADFVDLLERHGTRPQVMLVRCGDDLDWHLGARAHRPAGLQRPQTCRTSDDTGAEGDRQRGPVPDRSGPFTAQPESGHHEVVVESRYRSTTSNNSADSASLPRSSCSVSRSTNCPVPSPCVSSVHARGCPAVARFGSLVVRSSRTAPAASPGACTAKRMRPWENVGGTMTPLLTVITSPRVNVRAVVAGLGSSRAADGRPAVTASAADADVSARPPIQRLL